MNSNFQLALTLVGMQTAVQILFLLVWTMFTKVPRMMRRKRFRDDRIFELENRVCSMESLNLGKVLSDIDKLEFDVEDLEDKVNGHCEDLEKLLGNSRAIDK